ncbi:MAG: polysaccharide deacetylase family protein [Methanobacteriota archaeon]|nr:MAG: polysaccharide deacetylase family protein [Euryarchaeota archaeon]
MPEKRIVLSVDVERDISKYIDESYIGVKEGIPQLLEILADLKIRSNFFLTGNVCRKHPAIMKEILGQGHNIGCHGSEHKVQYYSSKTREWQEENISKAKKQISTVLGKAPKAFRAPNFSVNSDTIRVLESQDIRLDSSILPGRVVKKWRLMKLLDFREAPREPYRPSREDPTKPGDSNVVEIPVTENPLHPGIPIGSGTLNYFGKEEFLDAIREVRQSYVVLLFHPWELVDLGRHFPDLPDWVSKACKSNFRTLGICLEELLSNYQYCVLEDIQEEFLATDK